MKFKSQITVLVLIISIAALVATLIGIFSSVGEGSFTYQSIRGETIEIYGIGIYRHMSSEMAVLGIAQDYVTLFIGIPLLLLGLVSYRKGKYSAKFILTGVILYFFVTYLFYTALAMYNEMFLVYILLLSCSMLALILCLLSFDYESPLLSNLKIKFAAWFLLFDIILMTLLWLKIIIPPLIDFSIYPLELEHYTTLAVQGLDLGIFLPLGFVSAILALKNYNSGKIFTIVYMVFISVLMVTLTSKMIFLFNMVGTVNPAIFIMPTIALFSIIFSFRLLRQFKTG